MGLETARLLLSKGIQVHIMGSSEEGLKVAVNELSGGDKVTPH